MPAAYGNQNLTWLDSQIIGTSDTYTPTFEDVGKAIHCAANVDAGGATVWKTAAAPEILFAAHADTSRGRDRPGHAEPLARHAGDVRRVHPGRRA